MPIVTVTIEIEVEVRDPELLYLTALERLRKETGWHSEAEAKPMIGTRGDPDMGSCLIMLLDPGESPAGCSINESRTNK